MWRKSHGCCLSDFLIVCHTHFMNSDQPTDPNFDTDIVFVDAFENRSSGVDAIYGVSPMRSPVPVLTPDLGNQITQCFTKAIAHSNRVAHREHIKANRVERVEQFIVSLRRELMRLPVSQGSGLVQWLCDKTLWHDIGILVSVDRVDYNHNVLVGWVAKARRQVMLQSDAQAEVIMGDLDELERGLQGILIHVEDARRINEEGEKLSQQLSAVFE